MSDAAARMQELSLIGGTLCLDFANTGDVISDYADLIAWMLQGNAIDNEIASKLERAARLSLDPAASTTREAKALRQTIHGLFTALACDRRPTAQQLELLSKLVSESEQHRALRAAGADFAWDWGFDTPPLEFPLWILARSAADLLISDQRDRVHQCASGDCDWLFLDTSRNRSRRWCAMAECGNRAKARRNYARKKQARAQDSDA